MPKILTYIQYVFRGYAVFSTRFLKMQFPNSLVYLLIGELCIEKRAHILKSIILINLFVNKGKMFLIIVTAGFRCTYIEAK